MLLNYSKVLKLGCTISHGVSEMCFSIKVKCVRAVDMTLKYIRYLRAKEKVCAMSLCCCCNTFHVFGSEAVVLRCSVKKVFLEISQTSQENTCARVSFLIKLQASICNFIKKETLAQVFSGKFCKISKNTFLKEHLRWLLLLNLQLVV